MILEEIIHSVGYTQDGTKANFSFNEAKLIAERYAQFKIQKLTDWNESMMKVHSELDLQGIGNALGLPLGSSIAPQVLPKVKELIEQNNDLLKMINHIFYETNFQIHFPTTSIKVKNLLSKYSHLNQM